MALGIGAVISTRVSLQASDRRYIMGRIHVRGDVLVKDNHPASIFNYNDNVDDGVINMFDILKPIASGIRN